MTVAANNTFIRKLNIKNVNIGGENNFEMKPAFALEINVFDFDESSHIVKDWFSDKLEQASNKDIKEIISVSQNTPCDIIALKFNIPEENLQANINKSKEILKNLLPTITKPLMIIGTSNKSIDIKLLPELTKLLNRESIVSYIEENTYKEILPSIIKGGHVAVIRTPIDINLAKEMNILASDMGLPLDNILIDTDMGGLGYGLEYGYSIMERIKLAAFDGDEMLNMPLVAFVGEEALKAKEAKFDTFDKSFGDFKLRSKMFEISTASAVVAAGANLIVLENPESLITLKELLK